MDEYVQPVAGSISRYLLEFAFLVSNKLEWDVLASRTLLHTLPRKNASGSVLAFEFLSVNDEGVVQNPTDLNLVAEGPSLRRSVAEGRKGRGKGGL